MARYEKLGTNKEERIRNLDIANKNYLLLKVSHHLICSFSNNFAEGNKNRIFKQTFDIDLFLDEIFAPPIYTLFNHFLKTQTQTSVVASNLESKVVPICKLTNKVCFSGLGEE